MQRQSLRRINLLQHSFSIRKKKKKEEGERKQADTPGYSLMAKRGKLFLLQLCQLHAFAVQTPATQKSLHLLQLMKMYLVIKLKQKNSGLPYLFLIKPVWHEESKHRR